jgi:hypothetical protein
MKITLALLATGVLLLTSGCGDKEPSVDQQKVTAIHEEAPSWTSSDSDILAAMDEVCAGKQPAQPADVSLHDYGYLLGLAMSTCDK